MILVVFSAARRGAEAMFEDIPYHKVFQRFPTNSGFPFSLEALWIIHNSWVTQRVPLVSPRYVSTWINTYLKLLLEFRPRDGLIVKSTHAIAYD